MKIGCKIFLATILFLLSEEFVHAQNTAYDDGTTNNGDGGYSWQWSGENWEAVTSNSGISCGPAQAANQFPGAIVEFEVWIYNIGGESGGSRHFAQTGSGEVLQNTFGQSCSGSGELNPPCHWLTYRTTANVPGVIFWMSYTGSLGGGWNCPVFANVIQEGQSPQAAFKEEIKNAARNSAARARGYSQGLNYFAGLYGAKLDFIRSAIMLSGAQAESFYADWQERIANDPFEGDCSAWQTQKAALNPTGDGRIDSALDNVAWTLGWLETAYHSANRYSSGCGDWQRDRAIWALINAGSSMVNNGFDTLANVVQYEVGDLYDPYGWTNHGYAGTTLATILRSIGAEMRETGQFYQSQ